MSQSKIRRSQIITTFGPGALVDLPNHAAIIGSLEHWGGGNHQEKLTPVVEPRLTEALGRSLGITNLRFFSPPVEENPTLPPHQQPGIVAWQFPEWFLVQPTTPTQEPLDGLRKRQLVRRIDLDNGRYGGRPVVPVRFVQACVRGHISDIDWRRFAHAKTQLCGGGSLYFVEKGTSGDLLDIFIECDCHARNYLLEADARTEANPMPLGPCRGEKPWMGQNVRDESCLDDRGQKLPNRLLIRSASNAYFPLQVSAISIPDTDGKLRAAVESQWGTLMAAQTPGLLTAFMNIPAVKATLEGHPHEQIWAEIQRKMSGGASEEAPAGIKATEVKALLASQMPVGENVPESDFYARDFPLSPQRQGPSRQLSRVVLVDRLREVRVQLGFTRFEAPDRDIDYDLAIGVQKANLAADLTWLPATENRGEGVFLSLDTDALERWMRRPEVKRRSLRLEAGFNAWKGRHPGVQTPFPGVEYVLLHTLSHLLITAVSLECGYAASSIRERIYLSGDQQGILLYTGTPDAEGTLGGLVQVGKKIDHHLRHALSLGALCSNDPVCAQHQPDNVHEERFLHGAACHGCLLISEPSCEWGNELLDRALVVSTVERLGAEFFPGEHDL